MRKIPLPDETRKHAERLFEDKDDGFQDADGGEKSLGSRRVSVSLSKDRSSSRGNSCADYTDDGFSDTDNGEELIKKSAKKSAREYALLLVSTHTYTEKALFQKIKSKRVYTDGDITDAVEYVKGFGYVNDKRLAENAVPKLAEKCFGRSKICRYLASKGIDGDIIDGLDFSEIDFVYYCKRLLDRYTGKPDEKVMRALLNAGYTYDEISAAKRMKD